MIPLNIAALQVSQLRGVEGVGVLCAATRCPSQDVFLPVVASSPLLACLSSWGDEEVLAGGFVMAMAAEVAVVPGHLSALAGVPVVFAAAGPLWVGGGGLCGAQRESQAGSRGDLQFWPAASMMKGLPNSTLWLVPQWNK